MAPDAHDESPSPENHGDEEDEYDYDDMTELQNLNGSSGVPIPANGKSAKDPQRPRRKKARRACFACQRAHLTCGDERPCTRCVKRGLQDTCQDGVRKKAKYLNDVQPEALMPGVGGHYPHSNGNAYSSKPASVSVPASTDYYPASGQNNTYGVFNSTGQANMPPPLSSNGSFANQRSPTSPSFQSMASQQSPPLQNIGSSLPSAVQNDGPQYQQSFRFDTADPSMYNFDISGLNFGNQYGAMEFGMLGHMAGGAADSPSNDNNALGSIQMPNYHGSISSASGFNDGANQNLMFNQDPVLSAEWHASHPRHSSTGSFAMTPLEHAGRTESMGHPAYTIGAGPGSFASASPASTSQDPASAFDNGPSSPTAYGTESQRNYYNSLKRSKDQKSGQHYPVNQPQPPNGDRRGGAIPLGAFQSHAGSRKRLRDHAAIYSSVKAPYSYTDGFHSLLAFLDKRYTPDKRVRIAKAISSFRPTLINTYGALSQEDLIHSEKGFQRLLCEYDDVFVQTYGIPTVILRRTGEVALANKEFTILTGWTKDVLLGKAPNFNANFVSGGSSTTSNSTNNNAGTGPGTGNNSRGAVNTPKLPVLELEGGKASKPRPVLIAELMDHDSTVQFWEDCARLAYIDPSGECTRPCQLVKYRPKEPLADAASAAPAAEGAEGASAQPGEAASENGTAAPRDGKPRSEHGHDAGPKHEVSQPSKQEPHSSAAAGGNDAAAKSEQQQQQQQDMHHLGMNAGTVECMYVWNIKRDIFDAPMMFILTFMPIF